MHIQLLEFHKMVPFDLGPVAEHADGNSDGGERPCGISRDITTCTTLPLGASVEDLDTFSASCLDVPLVGLVKHMPADISPVEFREDVLLWVNRRVKLGDITRCDPQHAVTVGNIGVLEHQLADRAKTYGNMRVDVDILSQKLDVASRAMLGRQQQRAMEMFPDKNPRDTEYYKVHAETIATWKNDKLAPHLSNLQVYEKITKEIEGQLEYLLQCVVDSAQGTEETVDDDLMMELNSLCTQNGATPDKAGVLQIYYWDPTNIEFDICKKECMCLIPEGWAYIIYYIYI